MTTIVEIDIKGIKKNYIFRNELKTTCIKSNMSFLGVVDNKNKVFKFDKKNYLLYYNKKNHNNLISIHKQSLINMNEEYKDYVPHDNYPEEHTIGVLGGNDPNTDLICNKFHSTFTEENGVPEKLEDGVPMSCRVFNQLDYCWSNTPLNEESPDTLLWMIGRDRCPITCGWCKIPPFPSDPTEIGMNVQNDSPIAKCSQYTAGPNNYAERGVVELGMGCAMFSNANFWPKVAVISGPPITQNGCTNGRWWMHGVKYCPITCGWCKAWKQMGSCQVDTRTDCGVTDCNAPCNSNTFARYYQHDCPQGEYYTPTKCNTLVGKEYSCALCQFDDWHIPTPRPPPPPVPAPTPPPMMKCTYMGDNKCCDNPNTPFKECSLAPGRGRYCPDGRYCGSDSQCREQGDQKGCSRSVAEGCGPNKEKCWQCAYRCDASPHAPSPGWKWIPLLERPGRNNTYNTLWDPIEKEDSIINSKLDDCLYPPCPTRKPYEPTILLDMIRSQCGTIEPRDYYGPYADQTQTYYYPSCNGYFANLYDRIGIGGVHSACDYLDPKNTIPDQNSNLTLHKSTCSMTARYGYDHFYDMIDDFNKTGCSKYYSNLYPYSDPYHTPKFIEESVYGSCENFMTMNCPLDANGGAGGSYGLYADDNYTPMTGPALCTACANRWATYLHGDAGPENLNKLCGKSDAKGDGDTNERDYNDGYTSGITSICASIWGGGTEYQYNKWYMGLGNFNTKGTPGFSYTDDPVTCMNGGKCLSQQIGDNPIDMNKITTGGAYFNKNICNNGVKFMGLDLVDGTIKMECQGQGDCSIPVDGSNCVNNSPSPPPGPLPPSPPSGKVKYFCNLENLSAMPDIIEKYQMQITSKGPTPPPSPLPQAIEIGLITIIEDTSHKTGVPDKKYLSAYDDLNAAITAFNKNACALQYQKYAGLDSKTGWVDFLNSTDAGYRLINTDMPPVKCDNSKCIVVDDPYSITWENYQYITLSSCNYGISWKKLSDEEGIIRLDNTPCLPPPSPTPESPLCKNPTIPYIWSKPNIWKYSDTLPGPNSNPANFPTNTGPTAGMYYNCINNVKNDSSGNLISPDFKFRCVNFTIDGATYDPNLCDNNYTYINPDPNFVPPQGEIPCSICAAGGNCNEACNRIDKNYPGCIKNNSCKYLGGKCIISAADFCENKCCSCEDNPNFNKPTPPPSPTPNGCLRSDGRISRESTKIITGAPRPCSDLKNPPPSPDRPHPTWACYEFYYQNNENKLYYSCDNSAGAGGCVDGSQCFPNFVMPTPVPSAPTPEPLPPPPYPIPKDISGLYLCQNLSNYKPTPMPMSPPMSEQVEDPSPSLCSIDPVGDPLPCAVCYKDSRIKIDDYKKIHIYNNMTPNDSRGPWACYDGSLLQPTNGGPYLYTCITAATSTSPAMCKFQNTECSSDGTQLECL